MVELVRIQLGKVNNNYTIEGYLEDKKVIDIRIL